MSDLSRIATRYHQAQFGPIIELQLRTYTRAHVPSGTFVAHDLTAYVIAIVDIMSYEEWDPDSIIDSLAEEKRVFDMSDTQIAERVLRENVAKCAHAIVHIALRSPDPKLRYDASKYVVERVLGRTTESGLMRHDELYSEIIEDIVVSDYKE